jgi:hypothetical protein
MLKRIKSILAALKTETKFPEFTSDKRIVEAFTINGTTFYTFDDMFNIPVERAFAAIDYYSELRQGVSRDYLEAHLEAQQRILTDKRIDIGQLSVLNQQLKERLDRIFPHELVYKLASVVYFDKTENPYRFDYKYSLEKIKKFRESDRTDFFLNTPVRKYLPFSNISNTDLEAYMKVGEKVNQRQLQVLSSLLSKKGSNEGLSKELELLSITT